MGKSVYSALILNNVFKVSMGMNKWKWFISIIEVCGVLNCVYLGGLV